MVNFTVVAKETVADQPKSSSALVTVFIRDTNDNFPIFGEDSYEVGLGFPLPLPPSLENVLHHGLSFDKLRFMYFLDLSACIKNKITKKENSLDYLANVMLSFLCSQFHHFIMFHKASTLFLISF